MNLGQQLLFLFSALGALNGFFLSVYFGFFSKKKGMSNYFLSALLFVLSIRIIKSAFFYFNPNLSEVFIQIGLSACILIGPFLYLYVKAVITNNKKSNWLFHFIPTAFLIILLGVFFPYWEYKELWSSYFTKLIYVQWFIYIILAGIQLKLIIEKLFAKASKLKHLETWILSVFIGITLIWLGYTIGSFTSYIVGALSFSFVFYLLILFWTFKKDKTSSFFDETIKYANKKIDAQEANEFQIKLNEIIKEKELFKNPDLKLAEVANELNVLPHYVSQFLNDNENKSFSLFINEYKIEEAKRLLKSKNNYTIEAIGYECGFNSKSTFYTTFKKITRTTPANYQKLIAILFIGSSSVL